MNWTAESFRNVQGETTTWVTKPGGMQIIVTRHIYFPDTWVLLCKDLGFDMVDLHAEESEIAKANALTKVRKTIEEQVAKLQNVLEGFNE